MFVLIIKANNNNKKVNLLLTSKKCDHLETLSKVKKVKVQNNADFFLIICFMFSFKYLPYKVNVVRHPVS